MGVKKFGALVLLGALVLAGCGPKGTGPGNTAKNAKLGVSGPTEVQEVRVGDKAQVEITITRPTGFTEALSLKPDVSPAGGGVTAEVSPKGVKPDDAGKATLTVRAAQNAKPGEYKVTLTATPASSEPVVTVLTFKVPQ